MKRCPFCRSKCKEWEHFRGNRLCSDCLCEYRQIIEGTPSNKSKTKKGKDGLHKSG